MTAAVMALAAAAVLLAVPGNRRGPGARHVGVLLLPAAAGGALLGLGAVRGTVLALALVAAGALAGCLGAWRRAARSRERAAREAAVVEVAEALVGELRSGQPVLAALARAAQTWPALIPVATAARMDADVAAAFRQVATLPGAEGLREVASAWQVSQRSGTALTAALAQVAAAARSRQAARRLVLAELASAQATARLVAVLPVGVLTLTSGLGGAPWAFLLGHPVGLACLATAVLLVFTCLWWLDRIGAGVLAG